MTARYRGGRRPVMPDTPRTRIVAPAWPRKSGRSGTPARKARSGTRSPRQAHTAAQALTRTPGAKAAAAGHMGCRRPEGRAARVSTSRVASASVCAASLAWAPCAASVSWWSRSSRSVMSATWRCTSALLASRASSTASGSASTAIACSTRSTSCPGHPGARRGRRATRPTSRPDSPGPALAQAVHPPLPHHRCSAVYRPAQAACPCRDGGPGCPVPARTRVGGG